MQVFKATQSSDPEYKTSTGALHIRELGTRLVCPTRGISRENMANSSEFGNEVEDGKVEEEKYGSFVTETGEPKMKKRWKSTEKRERYVQFIKRITNNNKIENGIMEHRRSNNEQHEIEDCNSPENKRPKMNSERRDKEGTTTDEDNDLIRMKENFDESNSCDDANISCVTVWGSPSSQTQSYWFENEVIIVPPKTIS